MQVDDPNPIKRPPLIETHLEKETRINTVLSSVHSKDLFEHNVACFIAAQILQVPESKMLDADIIKVFISKQAPKKSNIKEYLYFAYEFLTLSEEWEAAIHFKKIANIKFSPINHSASQWTEQDLEILRIYFKDEESWENPLFNSPLNDPMGLKFLDENQNLTEDLLKNLKKAKANELSPELKNKFQRLIYMIYNKSQKSVVYQLMDLVFEKLFEENEFQLFPQKNFDLIINNFKYGAEPDRYLGYLPKGMSSLVVIEDISLKEEMEYFAIPQLIAGSIALLQQKKNIKISINEISYSETSETYLWPFEQEKYIFMLRVIGFKITFFRFKPNQDFISAVIRGLRPKQKTLVEKTDIDGKSLLDPAEREMIVKGLLNIKKYIKENF